MRCNFCDTRHSWCDESEAQIKAGGLICDACNSPPHHLSLESAQTLIVHLASRHLGHRCPLLERESWISWSTCRPAAGRICPFHVRFHRPRCPLSPRLAGSTGEGEGCATLRPAGENFEAFPSSSLRTRRGRPTSSETASKGGDLARQIAIPKY